jgi:hypothetical protein
MHFDFMTPDIWDGLVLGVVLIGLSLAVLRLIRDREVYKRQQSHLHDSHDQPDQPDR